MMKTMLSLLIGAMTAVSVPVYAQWSGFPDFSSLVRSQAEAEKLPTGTKVALTCKTCRALDVKTVEGKKTFLAWFDPAMKQKCTGCGGEMSLKKTSGGKGAKPNDYTHVCSKCGDMSAAVCIATAKNAKS